MWILLCFTKELHVGHFVILSCILITYFFIFRSIPVRLRILNFKTKLNLLLELFKCLKCMVEN